MFNLIKMVICKIFSFIVFYVFDVKICFIKYYIIKFKLVWLYDRYIFLKFYVFNVFRESRRCVGVKLVDVMCF